MSSDGKLPFSSLGRLLKAARENKSENLAEVSGAVEIDSQLLSEIEQGRRRPSEEILLLLISHFNVDDIEAAKMWEMAGYTGKFEPEEELKEAVAQVALSLPVDVRVVYTDMVHVMVNDYGVVMNFMQGGGPGNQPLAVSRVGMSKEHARSVLDVLQKTLEQSEHPKQPKTLPSPGAKKRKNS